jgi:DNA-binding CsgD family transcriptional regulator
VFVPDAVEALVLRGDLPRAEALADEFERSALEHDRPWALADAARMRALLHAAVGDLDAALGSAGRALATVEPLGMPFQTARALLALGEIHRRRREKRAAAETLERALAAFEAVGATLWADRARADLARVGLRRRAPDELTETELLIAELAASGLTNREVAKTAFVSPKTVEANLSRVYAKLGIRSRAELGAWMAGARDERQG